MTTATPLHSTTSPAGSQTGGPAEDGHSPTPPETMPDTPLRAVAYIRESTEEQGQGFSPDAQRERIREFAPENDLQLIGEYYSVSLSFWTRSGLREKARQGHLTGQLPWGYVRDLQSKIAIPNADVAPFVLEAFQRYATGQESDLTIAQWLNATGAPTPRGRPFSKDTVRGILSNAAYCGYVSGKRDTTLTNKGLHEPILSEELFMRVQEVRAWRARVLKGGPPSEEYLLRKLLRCERCGARMHGSRGGGNAARRYACSTRRYGNPCGERMVLAERLEDQLVGWIRDFTPDERLIDLMMKAVEDDQPKRDPANAKRSELHGQLTRLQDLYVIGDLPKAKYVMRRQAIEEELQRIGAPTDPGFDRARQLLSDFAQFWEIEKEPAERRKLVRSLFEQVWAQEGRIVAVQPRDDFLPYFQAASRARPKKRRSKQGAKSGSDGTRTRDLCRDRAAL